MNRLRVKAGARPAEAPTFIALRPLDRFGSDAFGEYVEACRGGVYDFAEKVTLVPRHAWPEVHAELTEAGFHVELSPVASCWLSDANAHWARRHLETEARLAELIPELVSSGKPLRPYQIEGVRWLARQRAAFLLDEQGTGKTIQALCAAPGEVGIILDVPASLRFIWRDEIHRWRPDLRVTMTPRDGHWPAPSEVYIVSDAWIRDRVATQPWRSLPADLYLISDEAHRYKGRSARSDAMQILCADIRRQNGCTIALTGTPVLNSAPELYSLFLIFGCARKAFTGWGVYKKLWHAKKGRYALEWGKSDPEVVSRVKSVSLRRTRAEVLPEIPPKTYEAIPCDPGARLSGQLDAEFKRLEAPIAKWAASSDADPPSALTWQTEMRVELARRKIPHMRDWIERNEADETDGSPLVIFSMHRAPIDHLAELKGWAVITGDTSPQKRRDLVSDFQAGRLRGLGLTLLAGGTGITLTAAHRMLFVDQSYVPAENWQGEDRVCRFGQTFPVLISRLVWDHPLERRLDEILQLKGAVIRGALGEG